jgi:hypothetical protein
MLQLEMSEAKHKAHVEAMIEMLARPQVAANFK